MPCGNASSADGGGGGESPLLHASYPSWLCTAWLGPVGFVPLLLVLLAFLLFLKSTADDFLSGTLAVICLELRLSHDIAGATLLALGNGAPDVFSSIAAFSSAGGQNADLGIASLLGGAAFVTTIVLGAVAISAPEDDDARGVEIRLETFGRDALFLTLGVAWLVVLSVTVVNIFTSLVFLVMEAVYVVVVVRQARAAVTRRKGGGTHERCFHDDEDVEQSLLPLMPEPSPSSSLRPVPVPRDEDDDPPADGVLSTETPALNEAYLTAPPGNPFAPPPPPESSPSTSPTTTTSSPSFPPSIVQGLYWRQLHLAKHAQSTSRDAWLEFRDMSLPRKVLVVIQLPLGLLRALTVPPPEPEAWSKGLVALHPPMCLLFLVWVYGGSNMGSTATIVVILLVVLALVFSALLYLNLHSGRPPTARSTRLALSFTSFCMCVVWIEVSATEIVSILDAMGTALGANSSVMGLSVLAWGNSLGDLINNVAVAKAGLPAMAVSACVAGPVFNVLVGLGLSLVVLSVKRQALGLGSFRFDLDRFSAAAAGLLVAVLAFTLVVSRLNRNRISRRVGVVLVGTYAAFMVGALVAVVLL